MKILAVSTLFLLATSCVTVPPFIDRQTVLEQESAGEWPEFEQDLIRSTPKSDTTPLGKIPMSASRERLYNLLNGELE